MLPHGKTVRKTLRDPDLEIKESDEYAAFHEILVENKKRHGVKPTHSLEDLLKLRELMPEKLRLNMVYHKGKPIAGGLLLFLANKKVALCFYNMLLYDYEHLKPIYLVMHETCRWAVEEGYEWVDIGVSQDTKADDPMTPSLGLDRVQRTLRCTRHPTQHVSPIDVGDVVNPDVVLVALASIDQDARTLNLARALRQRRH